MRQTTKNATQQTFAQAHAAKQPLHVVKVERWTLWGRLVRPLVEHAAEGQVRLRAQAATQAGEALMRAAVVGVDVEWRPDMMGQKSPASIIQVNPSPVAPCNSLVAKRSVATSTCHRS